MRRCDNKLAQQEDERVVQREDDKRRWDNQLARRGDDRAARREVTQPRSLLGSNRIDSQVVSDVAQKGIRTLGHRKDQQAKLAHPFIRVLGGPKKFWLTGCPKFVQQ